jgi:hypothetical protein
MSTALLLPALILMGYLMTFRHNLLCVSVLAEGR